MTEIEILLSKIISERYAKDVREAIHDAIYQCYYDSKVGSLDLVARQQIANLVSVNNPTEGNSELHDIRTGADGIIYESAGEAVRQQITELADKIAEILSDDSKDFATIEFDEETRLLHFYDESGVDVYDPVLITGGGGGGGATVSTIVKLINENGSSTLAIAAGKAAELKFTFTSTENDIPTGGGSCQITVNGVVKATSNINQGLNTVDVSKFLTVGSNTVRVKCTDMYGNYRALVYTISVVDLYITSTFDATVPYDSDITFKYTPYGAIEKTVYILIDGTEFNTLQISASGKQSTQIIPKMSHGIHSLEIYMVADLSGVPMESEHILYDIICTEADNTTPMIASAYSGKSVTQGELLSIPYIVYDPASLACDITLSVYTMSSGKEVLYSSQALTVDRQQHHWNTRKYPVGTVYFRIKYGSITKVHTITVAESNIQVEAETNDLELYLTSSGRSNDEAIPSNWAYGLVTTEFSNVNWASTGWVNDDNGDTCLRLNGDATAEIKFKPFSEDIRTYGKTLELEFAIRDVNNRDAVAIKCMSGGIGFEIKPDTAYVVSEQSRVFCNYKEEEKVRLAFVVESRSESRLLSIYLNGVLSDVVQYPDSDNFQQDSPVNITIGSEYCGVDLYTVRSYTTALTSQSIVNNFIADMVDIVQKTITYENNDIYDEYGNISFEKAKEKNSVMVITGTLPGSKGDKKKVKVSYYDVDNPNIDYTDNDVEIDVQGTSSQWYVRKNWKLKCSTEHYIDADHLPAKVICVKVDYAEATGTHNTQNANLVHTFYEEQIPPQAVEPKTRTTIYGKPILLFHQATETSDPVFYGKANYNYDKGAEYVFGFTSDYDVECWEFLNNTSDACNFLGNISDDWKDDFEARYPEKNTNISRFKAMHDWVVSTKDDVDKFKEEFEDHFDLHYSLIYYVYTFFALMVDQRAKNLFLTYWGSTGKWQPWFYDNDTCFGIDNWGQLVYDYYHEDTDKIAGTNVYTGQNSILWSNFREAFADEIKETYQNLRNNGYITYEKMVNRFITEGSDKWSESVYNEDSEFKYISMLRASNDATNLPQVRGSGEEHFRYFIKNRLNYCDSKWYASDYANDYASLRIFTPTEWAGIEPKADITLTAYSDMYAGVRYTASTSLQQKRVNQGESVTFQASADDTFSGTETAIYGASQISSLGDLAPLYCGRVDVSKADKLTELKIGDTTEGYSNPNLIDLSVGTNKLLKSIDVRNCSNLAISLDLSGCPNIEEVYTSGTALTGIELADAGCLRKASLPSTIANLTLKHQLYIEEITFDSYNGLRTLLIENCPTFNTLAVLTNGININRARLTNVNWNYDDASAILALIDRGISGIDENGTNIDTMWIDGTCHIGTLNGNDMARINAAFPYLTITYDNLLSELIYMSWDGTTELHRETIVNGADGVEDPIADGSVETPTRESTAQYDFEYGGWSRIIDGDVDDTALLNVEADRYVYAAFNRLIRSYTVKFYNGTTLLETVTAEYGSTAVYTGDTPSKEVDNPEDFEFTGWRPSPVNIQGDTSCYAQYYDTRVITDDWATIAEKCKYKYSIENIYGVGAYKELEITHEDGSTETIEMQVVANNHDELAESSCRFEYVGSIPSDLRYCASDSVFVYNNKIYACTYTHIYTWDGTSWSSTTTGLSGATGGVESAFVYNNEIYLLHNRNLWKWSDGEISIVYNASTSGYDAPSWSLVVHNDEFYGLGSASDNIHNIFYKWNGTSWDVLSNADDTPIITSLFSFNGSIYAKTRNSGSSNIIYKWNGTSWDIGFTLSHDIWDASEVFVYHNELYIMRSLYGDILKVVGEESVKIGEWDKSALMLNDRPIVVYNDEIHILGGRNFAAGTSAKYYYYHHKLLLTSWKQHSIPNDFKFQNGSAVVYNSELHIFGGYNKPYQHAKWDGTEWTSVSTLLDSTSNSTAVVYNDEIHLIGAGANGTGHWKWNGDSWTELSTLPFERPLAVLYHDELHIFKNTSHYKWDGSNWSSVEVIPYSFVSPAREAIIVYGDKVHILGGYLSSTHYTWDGTTWAKLSDLPYGATSPKVTVLDGELHLIGGSGTTGIDSVSWNHYKSSDGETWTEVETMPNPIYMSASLLTFRGHMYIVTMDFGLLTRENPAATLTFFAKALLKDPRKMNATNKGDGVNACLNFGGWEESDLREYLNGDFLSLLPSDLQSVIKPVLKLSDGGYYNKKILTTGDKIWLASCEEVYADYEGAVIAGQGTTYPVFTDGTSRLRAIAGAESNSPWWLRSTNVNATNYYYGVNTVGNITGVVANSDKTYIAFGFCI